ncbi:MAG: hypothetical protein JSU06_04435 [Actinobacteria bacterium]|nr:hypothetical protein [Actinomycetota bacterium]
MTEPRPTRRPGGAAVFWSSAALFAVLFALLTFQLSAGGTGYGSATATRPVQVRKVLKRRIVTTVVPSPGVNKVSSGPATTAAAAVPTEPIVTSTS